MRLPGGRTGSGRLPAIARAVGPKARWLELTVVTAALAVAVVSLTRLWRAPLELDPLLVAPPAQLGPLALSTVYIAAAAEAKVGGDLYEAAATREHGIRLIIGDVRGKGLGAVEVAADVLGRFREVAHEVHTLGEMARRLDAGLSRRYGQHEEFVTALLAEIDAERGWLTIFSCGHPPALLISADNQVTVLEAAQPAPPLGLITLGHSSGAELSIRFNPDDQLLLYTDGVSEARDRARKFYPLADRVAVLAATAASGRPRSRARRPRTVAAANGSAPGLLDLVRADLLRHVGAPLDDDAALLLVRAPAAWTGGRGAPRSAARQGQVSAT